MTVTGRCAPGYEAVREAFERNFAPTDTDPGDVGAAVALIQGGRVVVDLWGGSIRDEGPAWERDTLVNMYSVGKPVAAVLALDAVQRGEIDLDEPLGAVWPAFRDLHGETTMRQVLAHQAGLPAVAEPLDPEAIYDWSAMAEALARTPAWWIPGSAHGYHTNTFGFLTGEPICRLTQRPFSQALQDRICGPRGLDLFVGLPPSHHSRVAEIVSRVDPDSSPADHRPAETKHDRMRAHTYFNPPTLSGFGVVNTADWRSASIPSTNGHATARAMAQFYSALLPSAPEPLLAESLRIEATTEHSVGPDLVLQRETRFGLGFQLHQEIRAMGTGPNAFGHFGHGGSLGFADPDRDVAFCYLINHPGDRWQSPRTLRLVAAVADATS
ncbi:MAG: beta-lactamase family protein [Actinomycetia bacterium]|nr:beta-lactamase family protein [Actinomycetes bacterium]